MKFCPKCGTKCQDNMKFCQNCGSQLPEGAPQQTQQQYQQPNQYQQAPQQPYQQYKPVKTIPNGTAVASLVLALVGIVTGFIAVAIATYFASIGVAFLFLIPSLLGAVLGAFSIFKCVKNPAMKGFGLAIAGLIVGLIFFFIFLASANTAAEAARYMFGGYSPSDLVNGLNGLEDLLG